MTHCTLADTVVLEPTVKPEDVRTCLIEAVNYGWRVAGADGRCNVPANFVGWLLQENDRLYAALDIARTGLLTIERKSEEARAMLTRAAT